MISQTRPLPSLDVFFNLRVSESICAWLELHRWIDKGRFNMIEIGSKIGSNRFENRVRNRVANL